MFKFEGNEKIGKYLKNLIDQNYKSQREFCRDYIAASGIEQDETNLANRITQMTLGNKAIQLYDFPIFTELLGVTCEQILSAGECTVPVSDRVTNYSIASSKDPAEWEKYINREDKLILNSDEYCKTVLDYAIEFGNYEFMKYLMDNKYIWFDSGKDNDYVLTFGAGTSIKPRDRSSMDWGLECQLAREDELRLNLIALAADNNDLEMLNDLHARENPQLYYKAHYLSCTHPDFDSCYNERMVKHIASSSEKVLDYFTDSFEIQEKFKYKNANEQHTFMFPYISKLLDFLISEKSVFAETALKKALEYNKETYKKLCKLILNVRDCEESWMEICKKELDFYENGDIVLFRAFYSTPIVKNQADGIITNVAHVTKIPASPILKQLAKELNESYEAVKNLKEHLEEI